MVDFWMFAVVLLQFLNSRCILAQIWFNLLVHYYSRFSLCGTGICPEHRTTLAFVRHWKQVLPPVLASILLGFCYCDLRSWLLWSTVFQLLWDVAMVDSGFVHSSIYLSVHFPHAFAHLLVGFSLCLVRDTVVLLVAGRCWQPGCANPPVFNLYSLFVFGRPESQIFCLYFAR